MPKYPPRTDIGSFEVVENNNSRDVYLYWQVIPAKDENGDDFRYKVEVVDASGRRVKLENKTYKTYAKFVGLNFNNYRFEIASVNIVGETKQTAKIYVPSRNQRECLLLQSYACKLLSLGCLSNNTRFLFISQSLSSLSCSQR